MTAHDPLMLSGASPRQPNDNDRRIGERIVALRKARRVTQVMLAQAIGVTHTQLYKYEAGRNRVGAARLCEIAAFLEVPVSTFHEELAEAPEGGAQPEIEGLLAEPGAIDALRAFAAIGDPAARVDALSLLRTLARHCHERPSYERAGA